MTDETKTRRGTAIDIPGDMRPASLAERGAWERFLWNLDNAERAVQRAGLRLNNVYIVEAFKGTISAQGGPLSEEIKRGRYPIFDTENENQFYACSDTVWRARRAARMVEDLNAGIRMDKADFDIVSPQVESAEPGKMSGIIIPIAIGVVVLAGAIATAIGQWKKADELDEKYKGILKKSDDMFCASPGSALCTQWEQTKAKSNYTKNETLAESIQTGVKKIAGGIGAGALIAIPILAFLIFGRMSR